ncbi:MAG: hypothetical protein LBT00_08470 [Spirochaetaceae bacterium]|nr:hypothetical protein [Spirochaetaceae bacterium]
MQGRSNVPVATKQSRQESPRIALPVLMSGSLAMTEGLAKQHPVQRHVPFGVFYQPEEQHRRAALLHRGGGYRR